MAKRKQIVEQPETPDSSYRVVWEIDVDAANAVQAARQAYDSILNGIRPIFEVYKWKEPEMTEVEPAATVDIGHLDEKLPEPKPRVIHEQYMGPDIV